MKNKFEALTAFQSWPEDWQRLCAEYWAENDKPASVQVSLHPAWEALHKDTATVVDEPSALDDNSMRKSRKMQRWTVAQQEYLAQCASQHWSQIDACRAFLKRYPTRELWSVQFQYRKMKKANWKINY